MRVQGRASGDIYSCYEWPLVPAVQRVTVWTRESGTELYYAVGCYAITLPCHLGRGFTTLIQKHPLFLCTGEQSAVVDNLPLSTYVTRHADLVLQTGSLLEFVGCIAKSRRHRGAQTEPGGGGVQ